MVNLTAIQDLLNAGTPAVRFGKSDVGSGVATVDLYMLESKLGYHAQSVAN